MVYNKTKEALALSEIPHYMLKYLQQVHRSVDFITTNRYRTIL